MTQQQSGAEGPAKKYGSRHHTLPPFRAVPQRRIEKFATAVRQGSDHKKLEQIARQVFQPLNPINDRVESTRLLEGSSLTRTPENVLTHESLLFTNKL